MSTKVKLFFAFFSMLVVALMFVPLLGQKASIAGIAVFVAGVIITASTRKTARPGFKIVPWGLDDWFSKKGNLPFFGYYDKLEHAFFYVPLIFFIMYALYGFNITSEYLKVTPVIALALGVMKEIYDGTLYAREQTGLLQGDGFSFKDFVADLVGVVVCTLIVTLLF